MLIFVLLSAEFILEDPKNYTFMTKGGVKVPGIDDVEEFQATLASMKVGRVVHTSILFIAQLPQTFNNRRHNLYSSNCAVTTDIEQQMTFFFY